MLSVFREVIISYYKKKHTDYSTIVTSQILVPIYQTVK